jgi:hypothetical protein
MGSWLSGIRKKFLNIAELSSKKCDPFRCEMFIKLSVLKTICKVTRLRPRGNQKV